MNNNVASSQNSGKSSLDNLVHIASNMSQEFRLPNRPSIPANQSLSQTPLNQQPASEYNSATSTPSPSMATGLKTKRSKKMACVECRQQKSRCDAFEKQPDPCTRCAKKGLHCDVKSDYKRTYKRARIAQIEKEFEELKKTLTTSQAAELLTKFPSLSSASPDTNPQEETLQIQVKIEPGTLNDTTQGIAGVGVAKTTSNVDLPQHSTKAVEGAYTQQNSTKNTQFTPYRILSHNSSETSQSIPNTPSITRQVESNTRSQIPLAQQEKKVELLDSSLICEEKSVDDISLMPETIKKLYLEYFERYHPILPVVDVSLGPERIYRLCPALFWVIMFVSLRRFPDNSSKSLLVRLSPIVKGILAEIMISPITRYNPIEEDEPIYNVSSVYSVQAFLLYSYWPPITSSLSADSSYNTVGTAFLQAIRIGLHTPTLVNTSEMNKDEKTKHQLTMTHEQLKTWIFCNIASQTIATAFGFPACTQFESSMWFYNQPGSSIIIPRNLQLMMEIAQFEDQMAKALNSNPMDPCGLIDASERLPLLKLLLKRLDTIEITLKNEMLQPSDRRFRVFEILSARVHLLSYYFMDTVRIAQFELQKGLIRLYNAAIALINHTSECQAEDKKFVKYLPGVYLLNLWQAGCIIGKLIHSSLKKFIDVGTGKQSYESVITFTATASILKHDMAYRSSGITRNMWQLFRELDAKKMNSLSIDIRNRMSASVFFDCLKLLRAQVGITKLTTKTDGSHPADDDEAIEESQEEVDDEDDQQLAEMGNEKAAPSEDEKNGSLHNVSQKSTPNSTTSSRVRRARTLSNNMDAESKTRKIIRTIPLDPEPISIGASKRSSIFKVVNSSTDSSPIMKSDVSTPNSNRINDHQTRTQTYNPSHVGKQYLQQLPHISSKQTVQSSQYQHHQQLQQPQQLQQHQYEQILQLDNRSYQPAQNISEAPLLQFSAFAFNESPIQLGLENLDIDNFDHDMLWKDVDSVMNDFGFHTS